ncbi:uncharacterized protein LOC143217649 [Lasioglossum baleicum]|uniref:uncharacterized protein LOC143217649 n=1 Tax=Lasioglossum baleicum TaxID=434251 RepID=UPI003FCC8220
MEVTNTSTVTASSSYDGGSSRYFRKFKYDSPPVTRMTPYKWGVQSVPHYSKDEMGGPKALSKINSDLKVLQNDISTIDVARMKEVDDLFKGVQIHRSQYKDHTGSRHPLKFFKADQYKYQCAPGATTSYFSKYPHNYIEYKIPPVLPLTYQRRRHTPYLPNLSLSGIYSESSCVAYKR